MTTKLQYFVYDVFTDHPFLGNPLAVVHIPPSRTLSQEQKQRITKEFNFSETTFVHEEAADTDQSIFTTDIFTPVTELRFAGHPTVGTGFHLLSSRPTADELVLRIKAGDTRVARVGARTRVDVPVDFKVHPSLNFEPFISLQPGLKAGEVKDIPGLAAITKGMNFALLKVTSVDVLARLGPYAEDNLVPSSHFGEWYTGQDELMDLRAYFYAMLEDGADDQPTRVRTRMFPRARWEDAGTGSAASTLAGYLALRKGKGTWKFEITQGVEMGRRCDIAVVVEIGEEKEVERVQLEGHAVKVMEGSLFI